MSGVYIKDIQMPTSGHILIVFPSGKVLEVSADATQDIFRETQAISVPPHGRLIDADEPIEVWEVKLSDGDNCSFRNIKTTVSKFLLSHLMGEVPPTIIPSSKEETK